jgi:hypothetical protein
MATQTCATKSHSAPLAHREVFEKGSHDEPTAMRAAHTPEQAPARALQ